MNKDEIIKDKLNELLFAKMENADMGINIRVADGYVTLYGIVDTLSEKEYAAEAAISIPGVKGVDNSLTIGMDGKIDDDDISRAVISRITASKDIKGTHIGAITNKGIVHLKGQSKTLEEAKLAKRLASKVMGVSEVISDIEIIGDENSPQDDASLVNYVEGAFAASHEIEAEDVHTSCKKGVIYLEGTVDTPQQKYKASYWASTIPGVRKVVNRINTRHDGDDEDSHLTNILREKLRQNPWTAPGAQIESYVIDGIAHLGGEVYSVEAKRNAELEALKMQGINQVQNDIEVARH